METSFRENKSVALDEGWSFGGRGRKAEEALAASDRDWEKVTLPHTWNAQDGEDGDDYYERNAFWYRKEFFPEELLGREWKDKRLWLEFRGVNSSAEVYVNGHMAGPRHKGGYTAFRYDITPWIDPEKKVPVRVDVCADNRPNQEIAPISGDFNICGGIHRQVFLICLEELHFAFGDHGSAGLSLSTGNCRSRMRPAHLGQVEAAVAICNESAVTRSVTFTLSAGLPEEEAQIYCRRELCLAAGERLQVKEAFRISDPRLWDGPGKGTCYQVSACLWEKGKLVDCLSDSCGFRFFWADREKGFFLNGRSYPLRGVNRHAFRKGVGNALTKSMQEEDMQILRELGANFVRLAHYPHDDYFYELCDREGILVWTEIPMVNEIGTAPGFVPNLKVQLAELILQKQNHPCIFFWGLENEIGNGHSLWDPLESIHVRSAKALTAELQQLAGRLDGGGRYSVQAVNRDYAMDQWGRKKEENVGWHSDLIAWNIYPGWYPDENFCGTFEEVVQRKRNQDSRPFGISEYGWGANPDQHEEEPALGEHGLEAGGDWHPEEYQCRMHEKAIAYINQHTELWMTAVWVLFDFAVDRRNEGGIPAQNDKGLVTADRQIRKDAFYLYKANWNHTEFFTHICSGRARGRSGLVRIYVYSNYKEVKLYQGNRLLGRMQNHGNGIFTMDDVMLEKGNTGLRAEGTGRTKMKREEGI